MGHEGDEAAKIQEVIGRVVYTYGFNGNSIRGTAHLRRIGGVFGDVTCDIRRFPVGRTEDLKVK